MCVLFTLLRCLLIQSLIFYFIFSFMTTTSILWSQYPFLFYVLQNTALYKLSLLLSLCLIRK